MENNIKQPTFSIITINYNNVAGLKNTVQSVINQTCKDHEFVIIDGGSTDGSKEYIEQNIEHINYWVSEPDNGIYHAMNKGVAAASGNYCLFMNSGDCIASENVLDRVKKEIENNPADYISGNIQFSKKNDHGDLGLQAPDEISIQYFLNIGLQHQSTFIKTDWLRKVPYDENYKIASDWKQMAESLLLKNATYKQIVGVTIACFDVTGISNANRKLMQDEKNKILSEWFPPRIYEVLNKYSRRTEYILIEKERYPVIFTILNSLRRLKARLFD